MAEKLTQRDMFECEYISKHMAQDVYAEAKSSLESLRNGLTYDDEGVESAFNKWIMGLDWGDPEPQKRIGDIHIGGEIMPEFIGFNGHWCKKCGANEISGHFPGCPMLKSNM